VLILVDIYCNIIVFCQSVVNKMVTCYVVVVLLKVAKVPFRDADRNEALAFDNL